MRRVHGKLNLTLDKDHMLDGALYAAVTFVLHQDDVLRQDIVYGIIIFINKVVEIPFGFFFQPVAGDRAAAEAGVRRIGDLFLRVKGRAVIRRIILE